MSNNEFINVLELENQLLKQQNGRLYRRTLNQKRKILRLKKRLRSKDPNTNEITNSTIDDESKSSSKILWEDVGDIIDLYLPDDTNQETQETQANVKDLKLE